MPRNREDDDHTRALVLFSRARQRRNTSRREDHERLCRDIGQERMSMSAGGSASASDGSV